MTQEAELDEQLRQRSPECVLDDHLARRQNGQLEADLARNFAQDVVVLTSRGSYKGHDDIRRLNQMLREAVGDARYEFPVKLVEGPYAFIEWRAQRPGKRVDDGADSFVIRDGLIVFQTIHYTLEELMPAKGAIG